MFDAVVPSATAKAEVPPSPASEAVASHSDENALCYQKFQLTNKGGYVVSFHMKTKGGVETPWTEYFPVVQSRTIDLGATELADGTTVYYEAAAWAGMWFRKGDYTFCRNEQKLAASAYGTTQNAWIEED